MLASTLLYTKIAPFVLKAASKQLRQLTGISNSRYRKAELIQLAISY